MDYPPPGPQDLPPAPARTPPPPFWGSQPRQAPDPGTRSGAKIALIFAVLLIAIVATFQQLATSTAAKAAGQPPLAPGAAPRAPVQMEIMAKAGVKFYYTTGEPMDPQQAEQRAKLARQVVDGLRSGSSDPHDWLRIAIIAADLQGPEAGLKDLADLEFRLARENHGLSEEARQALTRDIQRLRTIYSSAQDPAAAATDPAAAPPTAALSADDLQALKRRHGWFGRLAATFGHSDNAPERQAIIGGGAKLLILAFALAIAATIAILAGIALFITGILLASTGKLRSHFIPPLPGGSIAIETVAVFVAGFLALKFAIAGIDHLAGPQTATWAALLGQWLLLLLIFWPVFRGTPFSHWAALSGLHRGRGILREVGAGILGYLAGLPLLIAGILITLVLVMIYTYIQQAAGKPVPTPENPIFDLVGGSSNPLILILIFLLASVWAPIVEEAIFRGAFYRHLRGYWHWLPAGIVTALGFGFMHGYPVILLGPVIALGFTFAMIREWRGSLIACITAHALHNTTVLTILLTAISILGD